MVRNVLGVAVALGVVLAAACGGSVAPYSGPTVPFDGGTGPDDATTNPDVTIGGDDVGFGDDVESDDTGFGDDTGLPDDTGFGDDVESDDVGFGDDVESDDTGGDDTGPTDAGGFMFNPDAACVPIAGGAPCDPGNVECGGAACAVPADECCVGMSDTCQSTGATCTGIAEACDETRDCAAGQICCLSVYSLAPLTAQQACQTFGAERVCNDPMALVKAQICKSDDECASGACVAYDCMGTTIVSCEDPYPGLCIAIGG